MSLQAFLNSILQGGRIAVPRGVTPSAVEHDQAIPLFREIDNVRRLETPGSAPPLVPAAAEWAGHLLYAACQFLVYRDLSAEVVTERLAQPCPTPCSPAVCYSVDLTFAALPDVISLARGIAADDPLTVGLLALAKQWPLSSVGVAEVTSPDIAGFIDDDGLARLYVDRIIERRDLKRLDHPRLRRLAAEAIGPYTELAPLVAAELEGETT